MSLRLRLLLATAVLALAAAPTTSYAAVVGGVSSSPAVVHRYASANPGSVNSFWLETSRGLVVVDASRNRTEGRRVAARLRANGAPVLAILVTHSHPDHVGGLGSLHRAFPKAPIYASQQTIREIRTDPLGLYQLARRDDPDFPAHVTVPDHAFANGDTLRLGGLRFLTSGFSDGESATATVYQVPGLGAVFAGDLVSNHMTPALVEGHLCGWLGNLAGFRLQTDRAPTTYPGHGDAASTSRLVDAQQTYLTRFKSLVQAASAPASPRGAQVTASEAGAIRVQMRAWYPAYPPVAKLPDLLTANIYAVAGELSSPDTDCASSSAPGTP